MDQIMIPLSMTCCFIVGFGGFLALFAYLRYLRYRETIQLAEKGLLYPGYGGNGKGTLRWGLAITGLGVALTIGLYPLGFWDELAGVFPLNFGPWMLIGLIPTFFGLSLLAIYQVTKDRKAEDRVDEDE